MTVDEWAVAGLNLAQESGKTVDDLVTFLRMASVLTSAFGFAKVPDPLEHMNYCPNCGARMDGDGE